MDSKKYTEHLLQAIQQIAAGEYKLNLERFSQSPELDALGVGIRMLAEEIESMQHDLQERNKRLQASKEDVEKIIENIQTGVFIIDAKTHKILKSNQKALELIGCKTGEVEGKVCHNFICPRDHNNCPITDHHELIDNSERVLINCEGKEIPVIKTAILFQYEGRECILESMMDISELKETSNLLEKREKEIIAQKEKYEELIDNMESAVAVYKVIGDGEDFLIENFNHFAEKLDKVSKEEIHHRSVLDVFPAAADIGVLDALKRVYKTGKPERLPVSFYKDNRISGWRNNYIYKLSTDEIAAVYTDETEMRQAYEELEKSNERFILAVKGSSDGIWDWDLRTNDLFLSLHWKEQLGFNDDEFQSDFETFTGHIHKNDKERVVKYVAQYIEGKIEDYNIEFRMRHKDGSYRWILARGAVLRDSDGKPYRMAGSHTDITEQKKQEQYLKRAREEAIQANEAKSAFLANMSHEIRTPMNAILGFSEILHDKLENSPHQHYVDSINTSGKTLLRLINDILDLSKIEAGKVILEEKPTSLKSIAEDMEKVFQFKTQEKGIAFHLDINDNIPPVLQLDEMRLRQVFLNLIGNAIKFTNKGEVRFCLSAKLHADDTADILAEVRDTGVGIPMDQMEKIFEAFSQRKGQDINRYGGTGLGLSISSKLIGLMKGRIWLESVSEEEDAENCGSSFFVQLKNVPVLKDVEIEDDKTTGFPSICFGASNLLLVDDLELNRKLVKGYLEDTLIKIDEASNGEEALTMISNNAYDLVLMDLKMPVMDGYEATHSIRQKEDLQDLPVLALTASVLEDDLKNIQKNGFSDFLRKPLSKRDLWKKLADYLPYDEVEVSTEQKDLKKPQDLVKSCKELKEEEKKMLLHYMEKIAPRFLEARDTFLMSDIQLLAEEAGEYANNNSLAILTDWAAEVIQHTESFDIEALQKSLALFDDMLKQLKN